MGWGVSLYCYLALRFNITKNFIYTSLHCLNFEKLLAHINIYMVQILFLYVF